MQSDTMASFWEAFGREPNRWEQLRKIFEKLRMILDMPALCPGGTDDLLEQLEQRLAEAGQLFPEPDWLADEGAGPEGLECYCANHVGAMLEILSFAVDRLGEIRAGELAACDGPGTGKKEA